MIISCYMIISFTPPPPDPPENYGRNTMPLNALVGLLLACTGPPPAIALEARHAVTASCQPYLVTP
jgi:hypothetical protein